MDRRIQITSNQQGEFPKLEDICISEFASSLGISISEKSKAFYSRGSRVRNIPYDSENGFTSEEQKSLVDNGFSLQSYRLFYGDRQEEFKIEMINMRTKKYGGVNVADGILCFISPTKGGTEPSKAQQSAIDATVEQISSMYKAYEVKS